MQASREPSPDPEAYNFESCTSAKSFTSGAVRAATSYGLHLLQGAMPAATASSREPK